MSGGDFGIIAWFIKGTATYLHNCNHYTFCHQICKYKQTRPGLEERLNELIPTSCRKTVRLSCQGNTGYIK